MTDKKSKTEDRLEHEFDERYALKLILTAANKASYEDINCYLEDIDSWQEFKETMEALAREREIALRELMNGLDSVGFIRKFCSNEEFRKRVQEISDMGVVED